jgi:hypothetical protein
MKRVGRIPPHPGSDPPTGPQARSGTETARTEIADAPNPGRPVPASPKLPTAADPEPVGIGPRAVPALSPLVRERKPKVRLRAVEALGAIGPAAAPAVADLTRLLDDRDPETRRSAETALKAIQPESHRATAAGELPSDRDPSLAAGAVVRPVEIDVQAERASEPQRQAR